jgi:hypothetical protein
MVEVVCGGTALIGIGFNAYERKTPRLWDRALCVGLGKFLGALRHRPVHLAKVAVLLSDGRKLDA